MLQVVIESYCMLWNFATDALIGCRSSIRCNRHRRLRVDLLSPQARASHAEQRPRFLDTQGNAQIRDAHGQAAFILVESLIHELCENGTLSASEAIEIVERAVEVQEEVAQGAGGAAQPMWRSHMLLTAIAKSLRADGDGNSPVFRRIR